MKEFFEFCKFFGNFINFNDVNGAGSVYIIFYWIAICISLGFVLLNHLIDMNDDYKQYNDLRRTKFSDRFKYSWNNILLNLICNFIVITIIFVIGINIPGKDGIQGMYSSILVVGLCIHMISNYKNSITGYFTIKGAKEVQRLVKIKEYTELYNKIKNKKYVA